MNARITKPEFDSAILGCMPKLSNAQLVHLEAAHRRDEAIANWIRKTVTGVFRAVVEYPRRRRVYDELTMLTDRELADIGLSRGDIPRIFEEEFVSREKTAANAPTTARPAAA